MKRARQAAIVRIVEDRPVHTQDELVQALRDEGFDITQATVSRDIRELRLAKVAAGGGAYRYAVPAESGSERLEVIESRAARAFSDYVLHIEAVASMVVIRTSPGSAQAVAAALDELALARVAATLAGDDTILVVVRPEGPPTEAADRVARRLQALRERPRDARRGGG